MKAALRGAVVRLRVPMAALFWLCVWQAASMRLNQEILLVSPLRAASALFRLMGTAGFYAALGATFGRILAGFFMAAAAAVLLASLSARFSFVRILLGPLMQAVKATPVASFVILALLFFSSRRLSVFISFLMVLPILYTNTLDGIFSADGKLLEMARIFKLSGARRAAAIYAPAAFPYFLSGCAVSLGVCWKAGVAAEVIGLPSGSVGERLYQAKIFLNTPELFAWTLAIIGISVAFETLVMRAMGRVKRRLG